MKSLPLIAFAFAMIANGNSCPAETTDNQATVSKLPSQEARVSELKDLKWGLFLHWSLGTFSGQEWTKGVTSVDFFRPTGLDTDQWCRAAKEGGMGYIILVSKHHDGFCLWDTKTTEFKATNSPLKKDVLRELRKSCDKFGLKLALYFSEGDWTWVNFKNPDMKRQQLTELLTEYGPICMIWMDTAQWDGGLGHKETEALVRSLQPNCFVGFNHGMPAGDLELREMGGQEPLRRLRDSPMSEKQLNEMTKDAEKLVMALDWPAASAIEAKLWDQYGGHIAAECSICANQRDGKVYWFYNEDTKDNAIPAAEIFGIYSRCRENGLIFSYATGPDKSGRLREIDLKRITEVKAMIDAKSVSSP